MLTRLVLSLVLGSGAATAQGRTGNLVGEHGASAVYVETDPMECFAISGGLDGPLTGSRIEPGLLVAIWPDRGGLPEFSFTTEGPGILPGAELAADTGAVWPLVPQGNWAWPEDPASDAAIAAVLQGASEVMVSGQLSSGKGFVARFSLNGYAAALAEASRLCGAGKPGKPG